MCAAFVSEYRLFTLCLFSHGSSPACLDFVTKCVYLYIESNVNAQGTWLQNGRSKFRMRTHLFKPYTHGMVCRTKNERSGTLKQKTP